MNWYESLRRSAQSQWFQPSDWAQAALVVEAIDMYVAKPTAAMLLAIKASGTDLLVTEGDRRRLHIELEKPVVVEVADVSELAEWRGRLQSS